MPGEALAVVGASGGEVSWPGERWKLLAESAAVLLLVVSLFPCSLDAVIVVTDASVLEVCIFILLFLGGI
jgi:hypothetical protein